MPSAAGAGSVGSGLGAKERLGADESAGSGSESSGRSAEEPSRTAAGFIPLPAEASPSVALTGKRPAVGVAAPPAPLSEGLGFGLLSRSNGEESPSGSGRSLGLGNPGFYFIPPPLAGAASSPPSLESAG